MNVSKFLPREGYLVVVKSSSDVTTSSGLVVEENSDDLLVHAPVVRSSSLAYPLGIDVVFHALDAQEFRDASKGFLLIHESDVLGTYLN